MRISQNVGCGLVAALALCLPGRAQACGGFFCNAMAVNQAGEQIAFVYEADGTVTTVVQIRYQGPSEEFAWIVPVRRLPSVELGTAAMFSVLQAATRPSWRLASREDGRCRDDFCGGACAPGMICLDAGIPAPEPNVDVESRMELGPYEVAVLSADDVGALRRWLDENGYLVRPGIEGVLAEYVDTGHHFVALRLRSNAVAGDLQPIVLRSASNEPCIPLRLTSIAAEPDMPITVYVLADRRARPLSWLLVELELGDVGFWRGTVPYWEMLTRTVDAAGGHAFVTEFAGPTPTNAPVELPVDQSTLASQRSIRAVSAALGLASADPIARRIVQRHARYAAFDAPALAAELETAVLAPRRAAQAMLDSRVWLTRMSTTVSPAEMTDDPTFVLSNELAPEHDNRLVATRVRECSLQYDSFDAPTHLELPDGTTLPLSPGRLVAESSCPWVLTPGGGGGCAVTRARRWPSPWLLGCLFGVLCMRTRTRRVQAPISSGSGNQRSDSKSSLS